MKKKVFQKSITCATHIFLYYSWDTLRTTAMEIRLNATKIHFVWWMKELLLWTTIATLDNNLKFQRKALFMGKKRNNRKIQSWCISKILAKHIYCLRKIIKS